MSDRHFYHNIPGIVCPHCGAGHIDVTEGINQNSQTICVKCGYTDELKKFWSNEHWKEHQPK